MQSAGKCRNVEYEPTAVGMAVGEAFDTYKGWLRITRFGIQLFNNYPGRHSLAILSCVLMLVLVLKNSQFCITAALLSGLLACWPSQLKSLAITGSGRSVYASLTRFNSRRHRAANGMSSQATEFSSISVDLRKL